ncbi:MAG: cell division protein FtsA [Campylobacteraceae bacterium 4484_166]|nr:MAG: cell division protein FtsA [Campylobacteraceae bacterium 4484_166]
MDNAKLTIDIGSSTIDAIISQTTYDDKIKILSKGVAKSQGIKNGDVINIDDLSDAINKAVIGAKGDTNVKINKATVSISGSYINTRSSSGSIIIQTGQVNKKDIKKVLDVAHHNANIISEYSLIHLMPISYKIDDIEMDAPLNMTGSRLEVITSIVVARKSTLLNIENSLKACALKVDNYVLSSYASALATLNEQEKKDGCALIDIGSNSTDIVLVKNKAIVYNIYIPIGSAHITQDICEMAETPLEAAEVLKSQYGTLLAFEADNPMADREVAIPHKIESNKEHTIALKNLQIIIHARVEEMLVLAFAKIKNSEMLHTIKSNIILTGGMSKLEGLPNLAKKIFAGYNVSIGKTKDIANEFIDLKDNSKATSVGLIIYALNKTMIFELDSNKELKSSFDKIDIISNQETKKLDNLQLKDKQQNEDINITADTANDSTLIDKFKKMTKDWF